MWNELCDKALEEKEPTALEALEDLRFQVGNITYFTRDLRMTTFKVRDSGLFEIIKKDLEVLEEHKQIEKELGIDLITWFKLSKAGNVYAYGWNGIMKCSLTGVNFEEISMWNGTTSLSYPLCEYGISFALTREELEK